MEELLTLVDADDNDIGFAEKMQVHREGLLHRAFSIFIFDKRQRMLLQRRAQSKYHSGGLWSNTCCGHPRWEEDGGAAAHRRLQEEMGFSCSLKKVDVLVYKAHLPNGLTEHEYDHIYVGQFDGEPVPEPSEVGEWQWMDTQDVLESMRSSPDNFTVWFRQIVEQVGASGLDAWRGDLPGPGMQDARSI